ncbi:MAG: DUF5615 family PIN-like protein [Phycisphaerae bacterium]|nr:DUF5615 family PIN-like protein [Phycisphaerae bacterium]
MQLKLDENLGPTAAQLFREAGHDTATVAEQSLCGARDSDLIRLCQTERRCLVTLDLDFANPIVFRPADYSGIAVLRLPRGSGINDVSDGLRTLISGLGQDDITGKLWVVQRGRIRQYQPED